MYWRMGGGGGGAGEGEVDEMSEGEWLDPVVLS